MEYEERTYYELTHPQKRIWNIDKIHLNAPLHNIGGCLNIGNNINIHKMKKVLNLIIKKNDGLRLRFTENDGKPVQYIYEFRDEDIDFLDFAYSNDPEKEFENWSENLFRKNFILENNQLYYFAIYKISEKKYGVLLKIHHIISDGWSINLIQRQICEIYRNMVKGYEDANSYECFSYIDFIKDEEEYFESKRFIKNKEFWKEKFDKLSIDFLYNTSNSLEGKRQIYSVNSDLSKRIKIFSSDNKCSLNTFFILILLIYLNKNTNKKDIVIGTPVYNRASSKQKNTLGMFTSTVPFRFKLDTKSDVKSLIKLVNKELKYCFINQKYPYDLLVKDLELSKLGYDSLFKMCVNYYNSKYSSDIDGINVDIKEHYSGNQSYSLQLTVQEWKEESITLNFDYKIKEYSDKQVKTMYRILINIIEQILYDETTIVDNIMLLNEKERNYKLYSLNLTDNYYPQKTVCKLFEEQAVKAPDRIALEFKGEKLTYEQLNQKANQLAHYLIEIGINRKSTVAIMETHSIELMISILATLKTGAAYLPIDPNYPYERMIYMLKDSKSNIVLTNFEIHEEDKLEIPFINVKDIDLNTYEKNKLAYKSELNDLAYIIYTSGSTGKPKGVLIEHKGLTNYIWWANKMYLKDKDEVMALYSSISFDLTVTSIFIPLVSGNKIVIYDNEDNEFILYKILKENKVTVLKLTPSHLMLLKDMCNKNSKIKRLIVGGEDLKVVLAKDTYDSFGRNIEIFNEYGPTETVVGCMIYKYDNDLDNGLSVPIGYPADNVQIYVLDNELNPVPTGFLGEIYISGDGVARGYLNREDLTEERFIKNPFIEGKRMYKTGDTAKYLENGVIEYVGRADNQVKIRGHRIELDEIEKHLLESEYVKDAVVVLKNNLSNNLSNNKMLNAYVVRKKEVTDVDLKKWLLKSLPIYMIPNNFIFMNKLPLTLNGKLNYALLPEPKTHTGELAKLTTPIEKELIRAMEDVLGIENISLNDNYYQLGGDSIKAIQISSKLRDIGFELKGKDILACNSIGETAALIQENKINIVVSQEKEEGIIEKTPIIEWFFNQNFKNKNLYNQYILLEYNGKLNKKDVKTAVDKLVEYHDGLRVNYDKKNNKLYYNNKHLDNTLATQYFDFSKHDEQNLNIQELICESNKKFNIENSILFNVDLIDLSDKRQALLFTAHHLIVDGISWRIIINDFLTIIKQISDGIGLKLAMKTNSFKDWSNALLDYSKKDFSGEKKYWQNILDKDINFPVDYNRGKDVESSSNTLIIELDEESLNRLKMHMNEVYSIDLNETLIIGLVLTIIELTKENEVIIEIERHGREAINDNIDISRTIGWFTSMYPAYFNIEHKNSNSNIKVLKEQLRRIPNNGFNYSIINFLNNELKYKRNKYVRFNYLGDYDNLIKTESLKLLNIEFELNSDKDNVLTALIDITAVEINKKLRISVKYSKNRFKDRTVEKFIETYIRTIELFIEQCSNKEYKEFTPSDFEAAEISQEDLDSLLF